MIVSAYNQEKYIEETLQSVLSQTYQYFDLYITDDGSSDKTPEIIDSFLGKNNFKGNVFFKKSNDVGATIIRHNSIMESNSNYYVPLDGDDLIDPKFIELTLSHIMKDELAGFIYTDSIYFGEVNTTFKQPDYNFYNLIFQNYICYASLFKKEAYVACGGYNLENRNYYEDWELSIRLGRKGFYGSHLPKPLFKYRTHLESSSSNIGGLDEVYRRYIITRYPELYPPEIVKQSIVFMSKFPDNFMKLKREEQKRIINE